MHFCGHGAGEDGIAFEDEIGNTKLINAEALGRFFCFYNGDAFVFVSRSTGELSIVTVLLVSWNCCFLGESERLTLNNN